MTKVFRRGSRHQGPPSQADTSGGIAGLCVRRPVLAVVLNVLVVVAGIAAFGGVEIRELPDIDQPVVTIRTNYKGATPETIDKEVTSVVEGAVARTPGVTAISSTSEVGQSRVTVEFDPKVDLNAAASDLRSAVGNISNRLPDGADQPTVVKADANSDPIMRLGVTADSMPLDQLSYLVDNTIADRLSAVEGVADVQIYGDRLPIVQVMLDPSKMAARNLSIADLESAVSSVTIDAPAGNISDGNTSLFVRADAGISDPQQMANIRINADTKIGDIADIVYGPATETTTLRVNGRTGVGMGIIRQARSNTLDVSKGVRAAVDELNASLPKGVHVVVSSDDAAFISGAIREVVITLGLATAIVIGIIFIFLRSVRITFIPAATVPIALTGTIAAIWLAGFSINILSLLALVLATGLVVDDAIVVIENIARRRTVDNLGPRAAAVLGTRQVFMPVLATTATLVSVFVPISFFPGTVGRLFAEFGWVLAFAVLLSCFVALTLAPMLASRWIGIESEGGHAIHHNWLFRATSSLGAAVIRVYTRLLEAALAAPVVVMTIAVVFAAGAVLVYTTLPVELTPKEDRGVVLISVSTPQGVSLDYTDAKMRLIEQTALPFVKSGEGKSMFSISGFGGGNRGFIILTLASWEQRLRNQSEIAADLNHRLQAIPGVQVFVRTSNSLGIRGGGQGLQFAIIGSDYAALADQAQKFTAAMQQGYPGFTTARLSYDTTQPQVSVKIDRARASDLGIPLASIAAAVSTLLNGDKIGTYFQGDQGIDVYVIAPDGLIQNPSDLNNVQIKTSSGAVVPLDSVVSFQETAVSPELGREDQKRAVPIVASLADGYDMRHAMNDVLALAAKTLPPGMSIKFLGEAAKLNETSGGVLQTFVFAILVVLLVLAAQFESFISATILLFTVPFGLAAAIYAIALSGGSLNIYSEIGLIILVGLMAKNGILIVEFANQLRDSGHSVKEAIHNAALIRLRPVVMTMLATVFGGLPLILRGGAGAEARQALGWIIVGGLGFSTITTLFLTPVAYSLLARFAKPRIAEQQRLESELAAAREAPYDFEPTPEELGEEDQPVRAAAE
jgi:hydrophobic/amphiphilic exporter-1 (mainly G- bacteria), HAE1 family